MRRMASKRKRVPSRLMRSPFSKSTSASPDTIAARWKITSGRSATSLSAAPGFAKSEVSVFTGKCAFRGTVGSTTSCRVNDVISRPPSCPSRAKRSANFRPTMPPPPRIRMFMADLSFMDLLAMREGELRDVQSATKAPEFIRCRTGSEGEPTIDEMNLAGGVARLVRCEIEREHRDLLGGAEAAHRLPVDEGLAYRVDALTGI